MGAVVAPSHPYSYTSPRQTFFSDYVPSKQATYDENESMGGIYEQIREYPVVSVGVVGGLVVAVVGIVGYVFRPVVTGVEPRLLNAVIDTGFYLNDQPLWQHGLFLTLPSFAVALVGSVLVGQRDWGDRLPGLRVGAGVVGTVVLVVIGVYLLTAVAFGLVVGLFGDTGGVLIRISSSILFIGFALMFGAIALALSLPVLVGAVGVGAVCGVVMGRGLVQLVRHASPQQ